MVSRHMLRYLLLDLDNTVYSESFGMERDVLARMTEFIASYLGITPSEAKDLRRERVRQYGTTLEWLMAERGFADPEAFFAAVHPEGEEARLEPAPALGRLLDGIELPKAIFTNSPSEHARRVLRKLGIEDRFEAIYDIRFCSLRGKPHAQAFRSVCAACGASPAEVLFVDDLPRYVEGFVAVGGLGVLIDETGRHEGSGLRRIRSLAELPGLVQETSGGEEPRRPSC
jgi:putative hydrolase of the HAD superfamily